MLLIVLHHLYQISILDFNFEYNIIVRVVFDNLGYLGSSVFFLLSGFGLTCSLQKNSLDRNYYISHIKKLLGPFLFIWISNIIFAISVKDVDFISFIKELFTLSLHYSDSLWFFKVIFLVYQFVFLVHIFIPKKYRQSIVLLGIFLYIVLVYLGGYKAFWYNSILSFPIGMVCASKIGNIQKFRPLSLLLVLILIFSVFFLGSLLIKTPIREICQIIAGVLFALISIVSVKYVPIKSKFLESCGNNSLSIYLFHVSLLAFLLIVISSPWLYFISVITLTFALVILYNFLNHKLCIK